MVNKAISRNRKTLSWFVFFTILLYSFFGLRNDVVIEQGGDVSLGQCSFVSQTATVNEVVCSEKTLRSSSQTVLQRQFKFQKKSANFDNGSVFIQIMLPTFLGFFLSIMSLYYCIINSSHRFVIQFIHNKDGQKA